MARLLSLSSLRFSSLLLPSTRRLSTAVPTLTLARRPSLPPPSSAVLFNAMQCRINRGENSTYSSVNSGKSTLTERPSTDITKPSTDIGPLFPGCDYKHWLVIIHEPGGEGASKKKMIECYIQTLAKVLGSEEEAKKKIYSISCDKYLGFGCEIDEETSEKLEGLPGVLFVLPDSYADPKHEDYGDVEIQINGGELFVNGEIVERPPERQKKLNPKPQKYQDRPRNNDRTRNTRRKENTR